MRVAILSSNAMAGDAIGNHIALKLAFFLERGADILVFVEFEGRLHPVVRPYSRLVDPLDIEPEDWQFINSSDLVSVEYSQSSKICNLLPLLAGGKPRVLFDYHGVTPPNLWNRHNREGIVNGSQQRGLVWCSDAAVTHSRFARTELLESTGFPVAYCQSLGLAVDCQKLSPGAPEVNLRNRLALGTATILLFVGRLAPNKRVPVLVEALARLRSRIPPVHAVVIGDQSDLYQLEADRCRNLAIELGVNDRLHLLGQVNDRELRDAYRSADVFVMPSRHEGFCVPVVEAMASGLPVIGARAAALPETVASAGLTFAPDDPEALAHQVVRVLDGSHAAPEKLVPSVLAAKPALAPLRVAVAVYRFGNHVVGGAEKSLRLMAETLHRAGHLVEIFTTCATTENTWRNDLTEGAADHEGIPLHRYRIDPYDADKYSTAFDDIVHSSTAIPDEVERAFLQNSVHSSRLLGELGRRIGQFDAVIAGPYLSGLTLDVARAFPDRAVVVPCLHDEPLARLQAWTASYASAAALLFHSQEEQKLAEWKFGWNNPRATCIGTFLDIEKAGNPGRGQRAVKIARPYLACCGRYISEKGLPVLLEWMQRYDDYHPDRFTIAFIGGGPVPIPEVAWARNLGFVDEEVKRNVMAGAAALVHLSHNESLCLVALEAWAQQTAVIGHRRSEVMCGHLTRCGGGALADDYKSFSVILDNLWQNPHQWKEMGRNGQAYVRDQYASENCFADKLADAIRSLQVPLAEQMRRRGFQHAATHERSAWRDRFATLVDDLLHKCGRPYHKEIEIQPRAASRTAVAGSDTTLVPVRLINRGTHPAAAEGPGRTILQSQIIEENEGRGGSQANESKARIGSAPTAEASLPALLLPGRSQAAVIPVPVPAQAGSYSLRFTTWQKVSSWNHSGEERIAVPATEPYRAVMRLIVKDGGATAVGENCCNPMIVSVQAALAAAQNLQRLPDDYQDITQGRFGPWKRWLKRKLIGNFKRAYVDVLSRQQSEFNQRIIVALSELAECIITLEGARGLTKTISANDDPNGESFARLLRAITAELTETKNRCRTLEARLADLEAMVHHVPGPAEIHE